MTNLHEILEKARVAGQRLATNEALVLFAAVVRLAASQNATLRATLVQIDEAGGLHLFPFDEHGAEAEPGYEAPELLAPEAPRKTEPRVQVYAAGALGYEILTGRTPPPPGTPPGAELSGPVGDIVRMALASDRRERFADLHQLQEAIEGLQPRPPAEGERNIFSALRTRWSRPPPEKEAVAKLIDRLHHVESQVVALGKAQKQIEASQRQTLESLERFEIGQRRAMETERRNRSSVWPGVIAGLVASLGVLGGAYALGMLAAPAPLRPRAPPPVAVPEQAGPPAPVRDEPAPPEPAPSPRRAAAPTPDAAVPVVDAGAAAKAETAAPPEDAAVTAAAEEPDAGAAVPDAGAATAATTDAGTGPAPARAPAAVQKKPAPRTSPQAAMQHAVAVSQVRRGESALEQGRADEALQSFRAALENEPNMAVAFRGLGMAYAMQGNDAQALQAYQRYLKLAPAAPDAADIRRSMKELQARAKSAGG